MKMGYPIAKSDSSVNRR